MTDPFELPALPLPGADPRGDGVGASVHLGRDKFGRWVARVHEDGRIIDKLEPELTAHDALMSVARNYPQARFKPPRRVEE